MTTVFSKGNAIETFRVVADFSRIGCNMVVGRKPVIPVACDAKAWSHRPTFLSAPWKDAIDPVDARPVWRTVPSYAGMIARSEF